MSNDRTILNWADRFALIDKYKPTDDAICSAFGLQPDELIVARDLRSNGNFAGGSSVNVDEFANLFAATSTNSTATKTAKPSRSDKSTSITKPTTEDAPTTATKTVKEPKKRGRKGNKMELAFRAIPISATPAEKFATDNGVSIAVLRQSKRFDNFGIEGSVRVKKDKETKQLMIWREVEES